MINILEAVFPLGTINYSTYAQRAFKANNSDKCIQYDCSAQIFIGVSVIVSEVNK